jgi:8-oxo-dGTP diphosphatase
MEIIVVNVAILLSEGRDVLLLKRKREPYAGWWSFPGGKLKHGETLKEGLKREIREETGLKMREPLLKALLNERYYEEINLVAHFILFYWEEKSRFLSSEITNVATSEEGELSWFPIDALPRRFVPSDRKILEHILENETLIQPTVFEGVLEKSMSNELILQEWTRVV